MVTHAFSRNRHAILFIGKTILSGHSRSTKRDPVTQRHSPTSPSFRRDSDRLKSRSVSPSITMRGCVAHLEGDLTRSRVVSPGSSKLGEASHFMLFPSLSTTLVISSLRNPNPTQGLAYYYRPRAATVMLNRRSKSRDVITEEA